MLLARGWRVGAERVALATGRHDDDTVADARLVAEELLRWARGTLEGSEGAWQRALRGNCGGARCPRRATTPAPWPTPGSSPRSCCAGPGAPWRGRRWPGSGPCWPPARARRPGPGAGGTPRGGG